MNKLPIDKGIPVPAKYPFADMQVGDSFLIPAHIKRQTVSVAAKRHGDRHGMKFTTRLTPERELRCWRIE